jgi:hypothetical protein
MKTQLASTKSLMPTDFPTFGAHWLMSGVASLYDRSKLADRMPPIANVVISNVPGPQFPLYLAGAKMMTYFPVSIVVHGIALNITVQSYIGSLDFGFTACRRALPDVRDMAAHSAESFAELLLLAESSQVSTPDAEITKAAPAKSRPRRPAAVAKKKAVTAKTTVRPRVSRPGRARITA